MVSDPRIGTELAGYQIESLLGRGGMSVVYLAKDPRLHRQVALKLLSPELAQDRRFRDRFEQESQVAASLDHPNVIPIFEAGEADGALFIAMRYVRGTDLHAMLEERARLGVDETIHVIEQVAAALDEAHEAGIVHRDVKPGNVLIAGRSTGEAGNLSDSHVYLSDFGLTKRREGADLTSTGQFLGSVDYVAPEQIEGGNVDRRADVYSLGCLLYECLAGHPPYPRDSEIAVVYAHIRDPVPRPAVERPELPPAIDRVVAKAMAKDPGGRYSTAGELATQARAILVPAEQPPGRPMRRRTAVIMATALALLAVAAVAGAVLSRRGGTPSGPSAPPSSGVPLTPAQAAQRGVPGLYRIDPATNHVVQAVAMTPAQARVVVAGRFAWVATLGAIYKVDTVQNTVVGTISTNLGNVFGLDANIAVGFGKVWTNVGPRSLEGSPGVASINPTTNRLESPITLAYRGHAVRLPRVTLDERSVWVAGRVENTGDHVLMKIDPTTRAVVRTRLVPAADGIAAGAGAIWILDNGAHPAVIRVDPSSLSLKRIPVQSADDIGVGSDAVFVSNKSGGVVVQIDPLTGSPFATFRVGEGPGQIAIGAATAWVVNERSGTISRIDLRLHKVVATIHVAGGLGITTSAGAVWVASCSQDVGSFAC